MRENTLRLHCSSCKTEMASSASQEAELSRSFSHWLPGDSWFQMVRWFRQPRISHWDREGIACVLPWMVVLWDSFWNQHPTPRRAEEERCRQWKSDGSWRALAASPLCIFILVSKPGGVGKQGFTEAHTAVSRLLRTTIHCFSLFSRSSCSRQQVMLGK